VFVPLLTFFIFFYPPCFPPNRINTRLDFAERLQGSPTHTVPKYFTVTPINQRDTISTFINRTSSNNLQMFRLDSDRETWRRSTSNQISTVNLWTLTAVHRDTSC